MPSAFVALPTSWRVRTGTGFNGGGWFLPRLPQADVALSGPRRPSKSSSGGLAGCQGSLRVTQSTATLIKMLPCRRSTRVQEVRQTRRACEHGSEMSLRGTAVHTMAQGHDDLDAVGRPGPGPKSRDPCSCLQQDRTYCLDFTSVAAVHRTWVDVRVGGRVGQLPPVVPLYSYHSVTKQTKLHGPRITDVTSQTTCIPGAFLHSHSNVTCNLLEQLQQQSQPALSGSSDPQLQDFFCIFSVSPSAGRSLHLAFHIEPVAASVLSLQLSCTFGFFSRPWTLQMGYDPSLSRSLSTPQMLPRLPDR